MRAIGTRFRLVYNLFFSLLPITNKHLLSYFLYFVPYEFTLIIEKNMTTNIQIVKCKGHPNIQKMVSNYYTFFI